MQIDEGITIAVDEVRIYKREIYRTELIICLCLLYGFYFRRPNGYVD